MRPERVILHADMDAFFASIEQRDHPELRGWPVVVGAVSPRGVVAAASYEARHYGIRSAMPGFEAHKLCPDGVFLPSDICKYTSVSHEIHNVFSEFTPDIEPIALDEAFLDITGSVGLFGGPLELARRLKRRVLEATQLVISVGIAPNKLVAKIACSMGKPDGLCWVKEDEVEGLLAPLPVSRLWGVGPVLADQLQRAGFQTMGQLGRAHPATLQAIVGDRALALSALARGEDWRPVEAQRQAKSYGEENTFEQDTVNQKTIGETLRAHAYSVAARLRKDGVRGRTVTLKVKLGARSARNESGAPAKTQLYPILTRRRTLPGATADGRVIGTAACDLWLETDPGKPIRLLGVSVSQLERIGERPRQLQLFDDDSGAERGERLGHALDAIRARFGEAAIRPGASPPVKLTPSERKKRGT